MSSEHEQLAERLQKLESELRQTKRYCIGAAVVLVLLVSLFRIQGRKLRAERVVAQDFVLTDALGRPRARLAVLPEGSGLELYAASGERRVQLLGGGEESTLNLYIPVTAVREAAAVNLFHDNVLLSSFKMDPGGARLEMHSKANRGTATLSLEGATASLMLSGSDDKVPKVWLVADASQACTSLGGVGESSAGGSLCLHSPGLPALELVDLGGNRAVIGIPHTSDLNMEGNSAASLILKQKSGGKLHVEPH